MRKIEDEYEAQTPLQATTSLPPGTRRRPRSFLTLRKTTCKRLGDIVSWYVSKGPRCVPTTIAEAADLFLSTLVPLNAPILSIPEKGPAIDEEPANHQRLFRPCSKR